MDAVIRIVIVGAGEGGAAAAAALRDRGFTGSIALVGAEVLPPYERPPLSKASLTGEHEPEPVVAVNGERLGELDVDFISGISAEAIDRGRRIVRLADGRQLHYDRLLLTTGARARTLPIEGGDHALTLRTHDDALAVRRHLVDRHHLVVLGAGFIGLEVAASARQLGCRVTVLEMAPAALTRSVPPAIAEMIVRRHVDEGVDMRFNARTTSIHPSDDGRLAVNLADDPEPLTADVVVAGIGATPNTELAADAGLECDNGIAVDARLQTSDPSIFAAGDCAAAISELYGGRRIRLESWRNAYDQAATVAANLLGGGEVHRAVPWFWSDQYDLGLQLAGLFDAASEIVERHRPDGTTVLFGLDADRRLVAAGAVGAGTSIARDIRVAEMMIGAGVEPSVDELIDPDQSLKKLWRQATV